MLLAIADCRVPIGELSIADWLIVDWGLTIHGLTIDESMIPLPINLNRQSTISQSFN
jgi:hypothetical protein